MQTFKSLVHSSWLGIALICSPQLGHTKIILKTEGINNEFNFRGYSNVFIGISLPEEEEFIANLKKELQGKGSVRTAKSTDELVEIMGKVDLFLISGESQTIDPEIHYWTLYASLNAKADENQQRLMAKPWSRSYILSGSKSLREDRKVILKEALSEFLDDFFSSNPEAKKKTIFYLIDPKSQS